MHNCAPQVHPSQASSYQLSDYCLFGMHVGFRVLNFCSDFSPFLQSIVDAKEMVYVSRRYSYERYQLQLKAINPSEVVWLQPMFAISLKLKLFSFVNAYATP